jgi:hypothetical protein
MKISIKKIGGNTIQVFIEGVMNPFIVHFERNGNYKIVMKKHYELNTKYSNVVGGYKEMKQID